MKLLLANSGLDPNSKVTYYSRIILSKVVINRHEVVIKLLFAKKDINPDFRDTNNSQMLLL